MSLPGKRPVVRICIAIAAISFCALAITHITHAISSSSTSPDSVEEATGYSCHDLEVAHINDIELEGDESLFSHLSGNGESLALLAVACALSTAPVAAYASETSNYRTYHMDSISSEASPQRERGNCFSVYGKGWCVSHGYGNNRPVGASMAVNLTQKEKDCLFSAYTWMIEAGRAWYTGNSWDALAATSYTLYTCLK
ncbi:hypothetical protein E5335_05700 [Coriobacteriaceae bacterium]|nr:hypothetical protein E5335_05700 [Coriobacteriaceae bacterium]